MAHDDVGVAAEGPRHEARERALALLYESEIKHVSCADVLGALVVRPDPFTVALLDGVAAHAAEIDELVAKAAEGWELDRMPALDRAVLRLATYELLVEQETPIAVVIDEAVELAHQYSTDSSGSFVNGVLATIARQVRG